MEGVVLIGGGGHALSCLEVLSDLEGVTCAGYLSPSRSTQVDLGFDAPYLGDDDQIPDLIARGYGFINALGQLDSGNSRKVLFDKVSALGGKFPLVASRSSLVSKLATLGEGVTILSGAIVNRGSRIGRGCIINTRALLEHGVSVGDWVHISTKACLNGDATVGNNVMIGSCAVVKQGVTIGDNVVVGMGSVVTRDLIEPGTYHGSPARKQK